MDITILLMVIGVILAFVGVIIAWLTYSAQKEKRLEQKKPCKIDRIDSSHHIKNEKVFEKQEAPPLMLNATALDEDQLDTFSMLIEASAQLLEKDHLAGSWGRTIIKYIDITQYGAMWTGEAKYKYLLSGSLTNTFHALNGLSIYYDVVNKSLDRQKVRNIFQYLKTWRLKHGTFCTPVTNFDASLGDTRDFFYGNQQEIYYNQDPQLLRHTACGILSINRLLVIRDLLRSFQTKEKQTIHFWESILGYLNEYNLSALRAIASYEGFIKTKSPGIWGKLKFTPAYVILAIDEGLRLKSEELSHDDLNKLKEIKTNLINFLLEDALQPGERFLFQNINKKAYYYFSLIVLEYFLQVKEFVKDLRAFELCRNIMTAFNNVILETGGLSFGNPDYPDQRWLNYHDIGITSRFMYVLALYAKAFNVSDDSTVKDSLNMAFQFIMNNAFDHEKANFNSLTQGWESIIQLIKICDNKLKRIVQQKIINNEFINGNLLELFVHNVSQKDFKEYNAHNLQNRFIQLLMNMSEFRKYIEIESKHHTDDMLLSDVNKLRKCLESYFSREKLVQFLIKNGIPFRDDSTLEELVSSTLMQFQFSEN